MTPELEKFIHPKYRYSGQPKPEYLQFNTHLQKFSQKVGIIVGLQTSGKISAIEAYHRIEALWSNLETESKKIFP